MSEILAPKTVSRPSWRRFIPLALLAGVLALVVAISFLTETVIAPTLLSLLLLLPVVIRRARRQNGR